MKALYFGLDAPPSTRKRQIIHCPLIRVEMRQSREVERLCDHLATSTHILFTSKTAVRFFFSLKPLVASHHKFLSIGRATTYLLNQLGICVSKTAEQESSEGIVALLTPNEFRDGHLLWPHSALSRPLIQEHLQQLGIPYTSCILYDTYSVSPNPLPDLTHFHEIVFTSPSTVNAFFTLFRTIPPHLKVTCIGPVTKKALLDIGPSDKITIHP